MDRYELWGFGIDGGTALVRVADLDNTGREVFRRNGWIVLHEVVAQNRYEAIEKANEWMIEKGMDV